MGINIVTAYKIQEWVHCTRYKNGYKVQSTSVAYRVPYTRVGTGVGTRYRVHGTSLSAEYESGHKVQTWVDGRSTDIETKFKHRYTVHGTNKPG